MSPIPSPTEPEARRDALVIAGLTVAGALLRLWSIGRLGLVHFDEGIYAMAGTWVLSPKGLGGLDPTVISYAPPGFPFLVGLAYGALGVGDTSAILASILAGTLAIPVAGWLGHRTFGGGAGAAASAFAAMSGSHIAFSRMALTDAAFALFWLVAIAMGQRFLERPGPGRAVALGIAVGLAQLFKYNGWIAGAAVAACALIGPLSRRDEPDGAPQRATWGWGLLAASIAAVVYWPWYRFVEAHGGYSALLAHHRSYMGGFAAWPGHAQAQFFQDEALSGGAVWLAATAFVAALAMYVALGRSGEGPRTIARIGVSLAGFTALCAYPASNWFGALFWYGLLGWPFISRPAAMGRLATRANQVLLIAWAILAVMTPFYHPYARLLLPLQALTWVLMGGAFAMMERLLEREGRRTGRTFLGIPSPWLAFALIACVVPVLYSALGLDYAAEARLGRLLEPSDSVRAACRAIADGLPEDVKRLRLYARPPITFYLSGRVPVAPQAGLEDLFAAGDPGAWVLLDSAMVRQGGGIRGVAIPRANRWELVREFPTTLNWPTMLDINPAASGRPTDRSAPLLLFRPKPTGAPR